MKTGTGTSLRDETALRGLLLGLLTPAGAPPEVLARLGPAEWERLLAMCAEHPLAGLLCWQLRRRGVLDRVPGQVAGKLQATWGYLTREALVAQREILLLHQLLADAGIPHLFLKGAYLAQFAYPQAAMRPLRDLDILLHTGDADAALALCRSRGSVPLEGGAQQEGHWHLPVMSGPFGGPPIELHTRLSHPGDRIGLGTRDALRGVWERAVTMPLGGKAVPFCGGEDLLLHLCVHGAAHHAFDNGPLAVADVAVLLQGHRLDWPLFWRLAAAENATDCVRLTLQLAERQWGDCGIRWSPAGHRALPPDLLEAVGLLTLRSFEERREVDLLAELSAERGGARVLLGRLGRYRRRLHRQAAPQGEAQGQLPGLGARLIRLWRAARAGRSRAEARQLGMLKAFLKGGGGM